jgi:gas vesicle protein
MNRTERLKDHERSEKAFQNHMARDFAWLIVGIGIGSGVALLSAPTDGEEVRHAIRRSCRKTLRAIGRHWNIDDLRDEAEHLLEETKDRFAHALHFGRSGEGVRRHHVA